MSSACCLQLWLQRFEIFYFQLWRYEFIECKHSKSGRRIFVVLCFRHGGRWLVRHGHQWSVFCLSSGVSAVVVRFCIGWRTNKKGRWKNKRECSHRGDARHADDIPVPHIFLELLLLVAGRVRGKRTKLSFSIFFSSLFAHVVFLTLKTAFCWQWRSVRHNQVLCRASAYTHRIVLAPLLYVLFPQLPEADMLFNIQ